MKDTPNPNTKVTLEGNPHDGTWHEIRPQHCWRFLLEDGRTIDVWANRPDSDLLGCIVAEFGPIAGSTKLPDPT